MTNLPNECTCSRITVHPAYWNQKGAYLGDKWYIQYRFRDPFFANRYPEGKRCIYKKGLNTAKSLTKRRAAVKKALKQLEHMLRSGYNPITKLTIPPPGEENTLQNDSLPIVYPNNSQIPARVQIKSATIILNKSHLMIADLIATELERTAMNVPVSDSTAIQIVFLYPNTPFIHALWGAYKKLSGVRTYLTDVRSVIRGITKAAYFLDFLKIPIGEIKRRHIKLCLEVCARFNAQWSNARHNKYRAYLLALFKQLLAEDAVDSNIVQDVPIFRRSKKIRRILTVQERNVIDRYLRKRDYYFWRFVRIFFSSGCRETEMMRLQVRDVDIKNREYISWVLKGRDCKQVIRPISTAIVYLWKEVLSECKKLAIREEANVEDIYLFSKFLQPGVHFIRPDQLGRRWNKYVKTELAIRSDFYSLKHLYSDLVAEKLGLEYAQRQNAHDSASTTRIYAIGEERRILKKLKNIRITFATFSFRR